MAIDTPFVRWIDLELKHATDQTCMRSLTIPTCVRWIDLVPYMHTSFIDSSGFYFHTKKHSRNSNETKKAPDLGVSVLSAEFKAQGAHQRTYTTHTTAA